MKVVLGSGTMGHSIVESFILGGYETVMVDRTDELLNDAVQKIRSEMVFLKKQGLCNEDVDKVMSRLKLETNIENGVKEADFIIESIIENLDAKLTMYKEVLKHMPEDCILSSNTSSLGFSELTKEMNEEQKSRFMMCHWYNPGHIMPLVELSDFGNVASENLDKIEAMFRRMGKVTIRVKKDIPGMVANRIQQGVAREVFWLMQNEIASPEDIDKALTFGPAFRYATSGQLLIADMGGLDVWCIVGDNLLGVMDNSKEANPILREKVKEGKLGLKSGDGFFKYPNDKKEEIVNEYYERLAKQLLVSKEYVK